MYSGEKTVEELKREWKKTKKEEIGVMYVNKLIAMNEYELAKKITLELKKYTKNKIDIYTTLGKIELYMGNIKEAKYQLSKIDNIYIRNTSFTVLARVYLAEKEYDKAKELLNKAYNYSNNPYALINLINMDLHERKYEEAYEKLLKLKQNLIFNKDCKYHYDAISVFLNSKLDKKINVKQSVGYHERQLEEYDKTCALTHIFRHVYQDIYNKNIHTVFANNIDVEYLFNNVPNMLNEDNYFYTNIFDEYYLNIDNVGLNGENYLIVGCIPGTKDIVSMYPTKYNPIKKVRV